MNERERGTGIQGEILRRLHESGGLTAQQLAAELGITSMGARRHLMAFEREGLVKVQLKRQPAGRPTFVYTLTEAGYESFPRRYDLLAGQLLDAVQAREGDRAVKQAFAGRMDQLVAQYAPRMQGKDLDERVAELARIQEENGYMASWEKAEGGYWLKEQNCAIYRIACRFQSACRYELELFRRLLDADITRVEHQVKGDHACTYFVSPKRRARRGPHTAAASRRAA